MNKVIALSDLITDCSSFEAKLHTHIIDTLFHHKKEVSNNFRNIIGLYSIEHIAIFIINPKHEILIFSSTPSVEYNLIANNLWQHDKGFKNIHLPNNTLQWWDEAYHPEYKDEIKWLKEGLHNFSFGINLTRKTEDYILVYSFATRNTETMKLKSYYNEIKNELLHIGDYAFNSIREIYSLYASPYNPPIIGQKLLRKKHLRLISS